MGFIHQVQNLLAKRFKNQLHSKWLEIIVQKTEKVIQSAFKEEKSKKVVKMKSQINPFLVKFFTFINIYMERMLFDKMKASMQKFLKFLLQFMAR